MEQIELMVSVEDIARQALADAIKSLILADDWRSLIEHRAAMDTIIGCAISGCDARRHES